MALKLFLLFCVAVMPCLLLAEESTPQAAPKSTPRAVLVVRISEAALSRWIDREVTRITPVNTCFQGTHIVGDAFTVGRPRIVLRDNDKQAAFEMVFSGTTNSTTTGFHHPVTLYGRSNTRFTASKRIEFQAGQGFKALPAQVNLVTENHLDNIATHRRGLIGRIVRKRAWKQANASRPAALEFARSNARSRILTTFDSLLEKKLVELNKSVELRYFAEDFFNAKLPPIYQTSTHHGFLEMAIASQPGAAVTVNLPPIEGETKPIQLWMHSGLLGDNLNLGLSMLQEVGKDAEAVLPAGALAKPPQLLPPIEIAPGVKAPAPQAAPKKEQVIWKSVKDWLVIQFEEERVAETLSQRRAAAKAKAAVAQPVTPVPPSRP